MLKSLHQERMERSPEGALKGFTSDVKRQLEQLEIQAQLELEELHEELLEMRRTCHKLEAALNESEGRRSSTSC